jgi:hypothetical protein
VTKIKQPNVKSIKLSFAPGERVTSFGGLAVAQRLLLRLGLGRAMEKALPARAGYSLEEITASALAGFLSGAGGTFVTEAVRHDPALLALTGLAKAPEEVTFWRATQSAGAAAALAAYGDVTTTLARRAIERSPRITLTERDGFVPVFVDGTLLEGSTRREGTKDLTKSGKGKGLMWTAAFVGPYPAAQRLCGARQGEQTAARELLRRVDEQVLAKTGLKKHALVLMDSLHGNGPTLDLLEELGLDYIVGARGLARAEQVLEQQPDCQWTATPEYEENHPGIEEAAVCVASIQCEDWPRARTLIGRRWRRKGHLLWEYSSVITGIEISDERLRAENLGDFAKAIWRLYNRKGACENHFKNLLTDLRLHHPPCQEHQRNAGFYAIAFLAGLACVVIDVLTSKPSRRRLRIATLRRWLFAVPARIARSGRQAHATILGLSEWWRNWIEDRFRRAARC